MSNDTTQQRYADATRRGCSSAIARAYAYAPATDDQEWQALFAELANHREMLSTAMREFNAEFPHDTADTLAESAADAHGLLYVDGSLPLWLIQAAEQIVYGEVKTQPHP